MTSHPPRRFCCDEDLALLACCFIHRHAQVERWMAGAGYQSVHEGGPREWRVVLYRCSVGGR